MGTAERRTEMLRVLCRRRCDTVSNLANEFSVSERTVLRDIEVLSLTEPIYTKQGKYDGRSICNRRFLYAANVHE